MHTITQWDTQGGQSVILRQTEEDIISEDWFALSESV